MPTVVEGSSGPRNRWLLPAVLALLIAAVVIGALLWPKIHQNTAARATSTAQVVVVTSGANPTPGPTLPGGSPTPVGKGSTPLPGASPVPSEAGLTLGMIVHPQREVAAAQAGIDRNDPSYAWYLDPRQVVQHQLPSYGFHTFQIVAPPPSPTPTAHPGNLDSRPIIKFIVNRQGKEYTVAVTQPGKQGPRGAWFVVTILTGRQLP